MGGGGRWMPGCRQCCAIFDLITKKYLFIGGTRKRQKGRLQWLLFCIGTVHRGWGTHLIAAGDYYTAAFWTIYL
jgi:hypothetical protein